MATFTITTDAYVNLPPSQVGDGTAGTDYGSTYTFTVADFTTLTTPVYSDPEGDDPLNLRVLTLPSTGELQYNSVAVTINQVISFSDIASGLFTYVPDNGTTTSYSDTFTFEISDEGSGNYTS
jgi:hypothetical protein